MDGGGGQARPGGEVACVDRGAPCGDHRVPHGLVVVSNDVVDGRHFLDVVELGVTGGAGAGARGGRADSYVPEAVGVVAEAGEDGRGTSEDGDGGGVKRDVETVIAELGDGDQRALEGGEDVRDACFAGDVVAREKPTVSCLEICSVRLEKFLCVVNFFHLDTGSLHHEVGGASGIGDGVC